MVTAAAAAPATTNTAANPNQAFGLISAVGAAPVTIQSPPVVNFTVIDSTGKFVPGLQLVVAAGKADPACSTSATATTGHVTFAMAKLNKPTDSSPSTWQSLISRQRYAANDLTARYGTTDTAKLYPTYRYSVAEGTTDPKPTATVTNPATAVTDPSTRIVGILEENTAGGYYTYRFATDVVTPLLFADAVTDKNGALGKIANNGNVVVKDGNTIYRVGAQLCYTDPASKAAVVVNPIMDFTVGADGVAVPVKAADGKTITDAKKVVDKASCNECHSTLKVHGTRVEPNYCVICHNPGSIDYNTNNPIDLKLMAHRIHMGKELAKDYQVASLRIKFTDKNGAITGTGYPQDVKNCVKCHTGTAAAAGSTSGTNATADGDNWKKVPSRNACGACHNGIDFAANTGVTIADAAQGLTTSSIAHIGGAKADDTQCAICHGTAEIPAYHTQISNVTNSNVKTVSSKYANPSALPTGAYKIEYVISSVAVDSARKVSVKFQIKKDGTAVNFGTYNATTNPNIIPNTVGGPSLRIAYNVTQDGITSPADTNAYMSAPALGVSAPTVPTTATPPGTFTAPTTATNLWVNPTGVTASGITWTMTGPDATNTYTINSSLPLPASTTMVKAFMYGTMTQTSVSAYPFKAASVADFSSYIVASGSSAGQTGYTLTKPGLIIAVDNASASVTSTGFTARRTVVDNAKCKACHNQLGLFTEAAFHGGGRNDGTICHICHTPNANASGWSYAANTFVHAIHGSSKRAKAYTWVEDWSSVGYPGVLKKCETCHVAGSYDFSATANAAAASKLLYNTVGTGTTAVAGANTSPYVAQTAGTAYGSGFSYATTTGAVVTTEAAATTLVSSPIAAACFSCHDSATAQTHMNSDGGGSIYQTRTVALAKTENCLFCHGTGKLVDIKVQHAK